MKPSIIQTSPAALSPTEQSALAKYEQDIDLDLRNYAKVGRCLDGIRRDKLHRPKTFEAYILNRFERGQDWAYDRITGAEVVANLGNSRGIPASLEQALMLSALDPTDQPKAWKMAVDTARGRITAQHVAKCVEEVCGKPAGALPGEQSSAMAAIMSRMSPEQMEAAQALAQSQARDRPPPPARDVGGSHTDERTKAARRKLNQLLKLVSGYGGDDSDMGESLEWALAWALRILDGERPPAKWLKQKEPE